MKKTTIDIEKRIQKSRDEIQKFLEVDLPLDIIYFNVRILSARIQRLKQAKEHE